MAKYQKYAEYKDSGVDWMGAIPKEWSISRLKYIFTIRKRIAGTLDFDVLSITQRGIKVKDTESGDGQLSMNYSKYQLVYEGDFAMNHMDLLTGYVDISKFEGVTSPDYRVFTIDDLKKFNSQYYLYLLQMGYKQKLFFHLGQGSSHLGRWRLPTEAFNEVEYPIPSLNEQSQIANFLDHETSKIDTLIAKQEKLIELLKEKRQAVISHAVTKGLNPNVPMKDSGVEWLGEVPEHWDIKKIKYLGSILNGYAFSSDSFIDQGVKVLKISNIQTMYLDWSDLSFVSEEQANKLEQFLVKKGDLVFALTRPIISTGIKATLMDLEEKILLNQRNAILRPNNLCVQKWLYYMVLNQNFVQEFNNQIDKTGQQPNISTVSIGNLAVSVAPIEEQVKIVEFIAEKVERIDVLIKKAESAIQLMQERRTALISAAVTGKIDVRNWQNPDKKNEADVELSA